VKASFRYIFSVAIAVLLAIPSYAGEEKKLLKKARKELSKGNYQEAKTLYNELLVVAPDNPEYHFEAGLTYYNSNVEKEKSVKYFEDALQKSSADTIAEIFYYLGRSYQYSGQFEKAIKSYNDFKDFIVSNDDGVVLSRDVDRFIEMCNNAIIYQGDYNKDVTVENMKEEINGRGSEYASVVNKDESVMIYTARKESNVGNKFYHDNKEYEDIYISVREGDSWTFSTKFDSSNVYISKDINSKYHDAAIAYNEAEDKLYIYRKNHVWVSEKGDNDKWTAPVKMNKNVNSGSHEPSVFITKDEQTLYVTSTDNEAGLGGRDIFVSHKNEDGTWGELELLPGNINTVYDEDAPYVSDDGKTMYFASNGHATMGGYDIFKTELQDDGTWSDPINLGVPINSPGDDIYYVVGNDGISAYMSSSRMGGYGDMDIYHLLLECKSIENTEIKGQLLAGSPAFPVGNKIIIKDAEGNLVNTFDVDAETGKYLMVLQPENTYTMEIETTDRFKNPIRNHKQEFTLPKQCDPFPLYQEVVLNRKKDEENKKYIQEALFQNAFFNAEDTVRKLYNIANDGSGLKELPIDTNQLNIAGNIAFNEVLKVEEGVRVYLVNENKQIIRQVETDENGAFLFRNLDQEQNYSVFIDEEDLKTQYYGVSSSNNQNGIIVKGDVKYVYPFSNRSSKADSLLVLLADENKRTVNFTRTDGNGAWTLDNLPTDPTIVEALKLDNESLSYQMNNNELDYAVSAFIQTIDAENTELSYTEYLDVIEWDWSKDTTGGGLGGDGIAFENIYFDFDKYFLRNKSKEILDNIFRYMDENPEITIAMDGHTDWFGTDAYNVVLSKNRSTSAMKYLVEKGIDKDRIDIRWHGESQPAVPNANPDGSDNKENRQLNRRVMFTINTSDMAFTFSLN
jgi:outer membrane protein OmpA-like peptidoglycan-associated protein